MARPVKRHSATSATPRWPWIGLGLALLSPLAVFVALAGLKMGAWPITVAYDTLTMQVAAGLAVLGVLGVLIALISGVRSFRHSGLIALLAVVVSCATVSLFWMHIQASSGGIAFKTDPTYKPGAGVSTDPVDEVGFSSTVMAERRAGNADPLVSGVGPNGCKIAFLPTQSAPGPAGYALQQAGFDIRDLGVNRANGVHVSLWFDRTYDAAIRIRPGRTDVRVAPRDGAHDFGTSCRLAERILTELQPRR